MLNIGKKKYRNLQEQVGYNTKQIDNIFSILDGIDYEDHVVVIEDITQPLNREELNIINEPVAFLVYEDKLYFKKSSDSSKVYFSAVIDISGNDIISIDEYEISVNSTDGVMAQLTKNTEIYSKNKSDEEAVHIQNLIESIGNASPKGVYPTIADLQAAFPTGTDGIYVVSSDGHWYYWNNNSWTDGGLYIAGVGSGIISSGSINNVNQNGSYYITSAVSDLPVSTNGVLVNNVMTPNDFVYKTFYAWGSGKVYSCIYRISNSTFWNGWKIINPDAPTNANGIKNSGSINSFNQSGGYLILNTVTDLPETDNGVLINQFLDSEFLYKMFYAYNSKNVYMCIYRVSNSTFWSNWKLVNPKPDTWARYDIEQLERRTLKLEKQNPFKWKTFDKPYFVFIHDDTNEYLSGYATVFINKNVPLGCATIPSNVDATKLAILENVVANGGEILAHYNASPTESSPDSEWLACTRDIKYALNQMGFDVYGIIRANNTETLTDKGEKYCRLYFDYANSNMGKSLQYQLPRTLMGGFASLQDFLDRIDQDALVNGIHAFGFHGLSQAGESWITNENMEAIIDYINSKGNCEIVTYKYLFDTFGSNDFEERLLALENQ